MKAFCKCSLWLHSSAFWIWKPSIQKSAHVEINTITTGKSRAQLASLFGGKPGGKCSYAGDWNRWSNNHCCFFLKIPDFCQGWIHVQEEKQARVHLFALLLVVTGCPALLLPNHITDASGPASQGWLPLGQQLEQQIKLEEGGWGHDT